MSGTAISQNIPNNEKAKKTQTLIDNEDETLTIHGYKSSFQKSAIIYTCYFITFGLLRLFFHWFPILRLYATHFKCSLSTAEKILIVDKYRGKYTTYYVETVKILQKSEQRNASPPSMPRKLIAYTENGGVVESQKIPKISCKHVTYVWNERLDEFVKLCGIDQRRKCYEFYEFKGWTQSEQLTRAITYGKNETLVPMQTILSLLLIEALTPFYIFQVFSLILWLTEGYRYYTIAIIAMSLFGITSSIIQTRRNQRTLREFHSSDKVTVCRGNGKLEEILSCSLVPGDVIEIPKNSSVMHCDAVLLNGSCIVNESMLTGESVPVTKTPIMKTDAFYDVKEDVFHTLYCGTKIIQTQSTDDEKMFAVVLRTGYLTTKGELLRSILYPPPSDFKFDQDSYKYIGILSVVAFIGFLYTVISKTDRSIAVFDIILKALDVFTIVIPPALPAAMTVGKLYALGRLKKHQICCMNSRVINVSGSTDCVCFDKTGTLTEDGLEMWGVVTVSEAIFDKPTKTLGVLPLTCDLIKGMATCHSIVVMDNQLLGDPLDIKVFESTGYYLEGGNLVKSVSNNTNSEDNPQVQLQVIHCFHFSSALQRMSVIIQNTTSFEFHVYCKGSPEMVSSLCKPETVPIDLDDHLKQYTGKGYRVIAMASKPLDSKIDIQNTKRTDIEKELHFVGLIVLENCVKPETAGVISDLRNANIKTIMITGDNFLTAISVAKECGIISNNEMVVDVRVKCSSVEKPSLLFTACDLPNINEFSCTKTAIDLETGCNVEYRFAVTGPNWGLVHHYFPDKVSEIVERGVVFARMSGKQKQQLIQELQKLGYYVAMCGDGANDCGALRAAHVGISLSEEESSIASPFTAKTSNITCVPKIIKEGRAALTTSTGVFKFMICYSLTQFTSIITLYSIDSSFAQIQFLFIDILYILNFVSTFGKTYAYNGPLHKKRPLTSLLCFTSVTSIALQMFFNILFQALAYKLVQTYEWYVPFKFDPTKSYYVYACYENYAVFSVSIFQYIILAISFSKGSPFRLPIYTNKVFFANLLLMTVISIYVISYPANWILYVLEMIIPPKLDIVFSILSLVATNLVCSLLAEDVLIGYVFSSEIWKNIIRCINPCNKSADSKLQSQIPFNLVHDGTTKRSIVFESNGQENCKRSGYSYTNGAYCNCEGEDL